jgi:hypothetical protein
MEKQPISWEAIEYEHKEKSRDWYWGLGIITVSMAIIAIMLGNYIFSIVLIISGLSLAISASRKPKMVLFELEKTGIHIDSKFTPYGSLKSFWVENNIHHDGISKLLIQPRNHGHLIVIPIEEVHPEEVRDYLLDMLLEEELSEPFSHKVGEMFGL